jgi:hypothetical protein
MSTAGLTLSGTALDPAQQQDPSQDQGQDQGQPQQPAPDQLQQAQQPDNQVQPTAPKETASHVAEAAGEAAQGQKTGMFKNILIGALKGLANDGLPGAVEGAIAPKIAAKQFQRNQTNADSAVLQKQANVASTVAEAYQKHAMADYYTNDLNEKIAQDGRTSLMGYKAYGINPMAIVDANDAKSATAQVKSMVEDGRTPLIIPIGGHQYAALDLNAVANTPADLSRINLDRQLHGFPTYQPQEWMNAKMTSPAMRTAAIRHTNDFLSPSAKSLPEYNDKIAQYKSYVKGLGDGTIQVDDPAAAKKYMDTALQTLQEGHDATLQEMLKQKEAYAQTRFIKLTMSDGTEKVLPGPEAVKFTSSNPGQVRDFSFGGPLPNAQPNGQQAKPNQPRAINTAYNNAMLEGTLSDGTQVAGNPSELQSWGVSNATKMDASEAQRVRAGRLLIAPNGLFNAISKDVATLQQKGQLDAIANHWREYLAGKYNTNPDFQGLRTDMGLAKTLLMQAHVGLRGSAEMLDHFGSLADYKVSDGPTLKAALAHEWNYVHERAMYHPSADPTLKRGK